MSNEQLVDASAQEVALHMAMCVNAEYIHAWGFEDFFERLLDYTTDGALESFMAQMYEAQRVLAERGQDNA